MGDRRILFQSDAAASGADGVTVMDAPQLPEGETPAPAAKPRRKMHILQLLPNLVSILALCCGLTAIRMAVDGRFATAVALIGLAAALDALDGRLARMLKSESAIGAELDSLSDFVNFGVTPALVLYLIYP